MRKIILLILLISLTFVFAFSINQLNNVDGTELNDTSLIYSKPTTTPDNKTIISLDNIDFSIDNYGNSLSHDWIENDDWDKDTLATEYKHTGGRNSMMKIIPIGASCISSFEVWFPAVDLDGVNGFMMYVDYSNLINPTDIKMHMFVRTNDVVPTGNIGELETRDSKANATNYYYDFLSGTWVETISDNNKYFKLPDGYRGYIYMPIKNFDGIESNGVGINDILLQMYHIDFSIADNMENVMPFYIDEIEVIKGDINHTHNYSLTGTVSSTCEENGLDLYSCSCGQVKWNNYKEIK